MQLILTSTLLGYRKTLTASVPFPPNPAEVLQWLGAVYKEDSDGLYYIEDKSENNYPAQLGGSSVFVGNGTNVNLKFISDIGKTTTPHIITKFTCSDISKTQYIACRRDNASVPAPTLNWQVGIVDGKFNFVTFANNGLAHEHSFQLIENELVEAECWFEAGVSHIKVNGIEETRTNSGVLRTGAEYLVIGSASWSDSFYFSGELISLVIKNYSTGELEFESRFNNYGGSKIYNEVTKLPFAILGDLTNVWGLSTEQYPYNLLEGFDLWSNGSDIIRMPIGVACVEVGYSFVRSHPGVTYGLNGSENTIIQHPDLVSAGDVFTVNPFSTELDYDTIVFDYENAKLWMANTADITNKKDIILFSVPQD